MASAQTNPRLGNRRIKHPAIEIDGRPVPDWMQLLSLRQMTDYLGVGKSIVLSPDGPPAIRLGPKTLRWRIADVWKWMDSHTGKIGQHAGHCGTSEARDDSPNTSEYSRSSQANSN